MDPSIDKEQLRNPDTVRRITQKRASDCLQYLGRRGIGFNSSDGIPPLFIAMKNCDLHSIATLLDYKA